MLNGEELIRLIDTIHRDKDIGKEVLFEAIEAALLTAVRKRYGEREELAIEIERETGEIIAWDGDEEAEDVDLNELGRIAAQTAKQVIIQKIRDAERDVIYGDFEHKVNAIVTGTVQRIEGGNIIVNLGKAEGIIPRHEKVRSENYNPGDRIKAIIYDVKKVGPKVKIMLSRTDPEIVKKLFELEIPEIAEHVIEIKNIAREPGFRTKIAVSSVDSRVDCIGACVGIRGSRIKSITDELNDEKIDIIRWNESAEVLIINALKPAQIHSMTLDERNMVAQVLVPDDMLSLAIGRKGQNVRLATKLTGWDIKIESLSKAFHGGGDQEEDPEIAGVREALLQGTAFERPASLAKPVKDAVEESGEQAEESEPVEETLSEDASQDEMNINESFSEPEEAVSEEPVVEEEAVESAELASAADESVSPDDDQVDILIPPDQDKEEQG
ncbi:MAG: transcription termination factor NusA [Planctomycetes bacterium]|nr:transcription termination factor NusA [Planctomycetota bacterium]